MQSITKFVKYFFDDLNINIKNSIDNESDGKIYDIQDDYDIPNKKLNIILCVENCSFWKYLNHYNKYGNYNNKKIKLYFYNHIDKIDINENYLAIPVIYLQMNYFKKYYDIIKPKVNTPFENKKFCLIATTLNNDIKNKIYKMLSLIDKCDFIKDYSDLIKNKSCYHDTELLNLFNSYKFVFVCENSVCDGYITEKIFNCYFARTLPIYSGSSKIEYFFNKNSFINIKNDSDINNYVELIKNINYDSYINSDILNDFDDENYKEVVNNYLNLIHLD
jgi:hypothetical protein